LDGRDEDIWRNLSWGSTPTSQYGQTYSGIEGYECNIHPFQELGNRKLQEEFKKGLFRSLACPQSDREWKHNDYEFE
jgi:hypothetical protein